MLKSIYNKFQQKKSNNYLLHSVFVLYFLVFISLLDLYYLSFENDIFSMVIFVLIALLTSFFNKNMIIILFIALTITNILKFGGGEIHT